jgi:cytochrome b pre-mRNA-processing protein 3
MFAPALKSLFRKDPARSQAEALYDALAAQARMPEFFLAGGVPDTPEGRFDLLSVHMFLGIRRLRAEGPGGAKSTRLLQEVFFERLDSALREMGVGDLSVGRKIRGLAEAFYGRYSSYEQNLNADGDALEHALARNVYASPDPACAVALAAYVKKADGKLSATDYGELDSQIAALRDISLAFFSDVKP